MITLAAQSVNILELADWISSDWLIKNQEVSAMLVISIVVFIEYILYDYRLQQNRKQLSKLQQNLMILGESKKKQQQKANRHSDHTEKLKGFIADKLVEYMDYDERYIHFKGIASEVRHNGVISYDKVTTALNKAIEQQGFLSLYEQQNDDNPSNEEPNEQTLAALVDYQGAVDAMRYLWALLDLSTADNMAIHIGNKLIECEENYYRLQLDKNKSLDMTQNIPVQPTFEPQYALLTTFSLLIDEQQLNYRIALAKINSAIYQEAFDFENEQFRLAITPTPELLGDPNHVILLLENLLKNAQFFSSKNRFKQATDRVNVRLQSHNGTALLSIYNRGPHIKQESLESIFKLGFSTRKTKENHGKGLGLFFAKEIVRGYQGKITAKNIDDKPQRFSLAITHENKTCVSYPIECQPFDGRQQVRLFFENEWQKSLKLSLNSKISSICLSSIAINSNQSTVQFEQNIGGSGKVNFIGPAQSMEKEWEISISQHKKTTDVIFKPLTKSGVQFDIELPTAESHL